MAGEWPSGEIHGASTLPRAPALAAKIKEELKDKRNTGKDKFERGMENHFFFKNDRVAEVHAGISGPKFLIIDDISTIKPSIRCKKCPYKGDIGT